MEKQMTPGAFVRVAAVCSFLLIFCGCSQNREEIPKIVGNPPGSEFRQPGPPQPNYNPQPSNVDVPGDWLPPARLERRWTAVVIHHSGTDNGNAGIFDREHRKVRHWQGVGYDFVIGNGTDSGDGQVEVTFRWRRQLTGAHCKTPDNWANEQAVGICLVGNFNHSSPTSRQIQSLLKLVRFLQKRYNIATSRVYGHNSAPGAHATDCPGRYFRLARFKSML